MLLLVIGCDSSAMRPGAVRGSVILGWCESTDVRRSVVELRRTADLADLPAYSVHVDSSDRFWRADFMIIGVEPDSYHVLVWKDEDGDETISDGDHVGVHLGVYARHHLGSKLLVTRAETVDVGGLELRRLWHLAVRAWGERQDSGRGIRFGYQFNHDCDLQLLTIGFPSGETLPDLGSVGPRLADSIYVTATWRTGGQVMPRGWYGLVFRGRFRHQSFVRAAAVFVE